MRTALYLEHDKAALLDELSQRTRTPKAALLREAVDDLLIKHKVLRAPKRSLPEVVMIRTIVVIAAIATTVAALGEVRIAQAQSPEPAAAREVVTKVNADETGRVNFAQATRSGVYREVTITWTPSPAAKGSADEHQIVLDDGQRFVVQHPSIELTASGAGFKLSFDFFMPKESVPPPMIGRRQESGRSPLAAALHTVAQAISTTALGAGDDGFSGSFTDVRTFVRPEGAGSPAPPEVDIRYQARRNMEVGQGRTPGGYCIAFEIQQAKEWVKKMRELNEQAAKLGEGWLQQGALNASPEYQAIRSQRVALLAQDNAARARIRADSVLGRKAGRYLRGADAAFALLQAQMIEAQKQAFKERVAALRRCHQNPTNPLAQKAKQEDRAAYDKVEGALDAVELEVEAVSGMRQGASSVNALAGAELGVVGGAMTGAVSEVEDELLRQSLEDSIGSLEKCVVKCCGNAASGSQTSTSSGQTSTPSSTANFTPGVAAAPPTFTPGPVRPSQPPSAACKPPSYAAVLYRNHTENSGCMSAGPVNLCASHSTDTMYVGGASLRAVVTPGAGGSTNFEGYQGTGRVNMLIVDDSKTSGPPGCPSGSSTYVVTSGGATLTVRAHPTIDNTVTGGVDTGGMDRNTSVVELFLGNDPVHEETTAQSCGEDRSSSGPIGAGTYDCHFYGVDLTTAGTYKQDKSDPGTGSCILTIY